MHQAVPQSVGDWPERDVRVIVTLDVPGGPGFVEHVLHLADEFGRAVSELIPGTLAHTATTDDGRTTNGLIIDLVDRRVSVDGRPVRLAYREFALLGYLAARPRRTVCRHVLIQDVWSDRVGQEDVSSRVVDTLIRRIRVKLTTQAHRLTTVRGRGYRLDPGADTRIRITSAKTVATPVVHP
ncbi:winged helix-turn-helix transcriptional regulator [Mycobacterium hodleri]|uniref:winged helix-turn-helix domain-containing protein n=1 Tax=Mycolicibacterium hodleri TaxID=49897 RepID=UPI0021F2C6B7|nr:winged helix-turn-helix domain-containing protein [Mycolicibacterium hodleri]MCV7131506.1 winged helix-turn-helix transcriptional regulator [Mycolicibacterium hodleri]